MTLKIYFANEQEKYKCDTVLESLVHRAVRAALLTEGVEYDCEISVTFTDNDGITEINREYRGKDSATDVLSFPMYSFQDDDYPDEEFTVELGDIVLSLEKAAAQAVEFEHSFEREVAFLCVHSVLHLLGYDHELSLEDEEDMRERQRVIMDELKIHR